jgi:hypothetical protein
MGKIVAGLRGECLLRLKEDESHKVEEGARFEVEAAKHATRKPTSLSQSKSTLNLTHWTPYALHPRRKMVDAARC